MKRSRRGHFLQAQLGWLIRLRWLAGAAMAGAGAVYAFTPGLQGMAVRILGLGTGILLYNVALLAAQKREAEPSRRRLLVLASAQIILDLACLSMLVGWTAGMASPILGFFVFHMIFASILLPRRLAYASAAASLILLSGALAWSGNLPHTNPEKLELLGLAMTLLLTVTFTNHITRDLRRHRHRLVRQNRHIRSMTRRLRQNQEIMIRQEKMVALGQMAAGVAHEVTNPLANMDSLLQLAQRHPGRMNEQAVATLREQISRINAIVHQMRSFAHPALGEVQRLGLNEEVSKAVALVRMDSRAKNVRIEEQLAGEVGPADIRPQGLQQVLVNLMLNSLDALAEVESPRLVVRTMRSGAEYVIEVVDNGTGIKAEHLHRLFEPFFTTKPVGKGTGLGLSISYNLVQREGGYIDVKSQVGEGTTMIIHLPAVQMEAQSTPNVPAVQKAN